MFQVISSVQTADFQDLDSAMAYAKTVNEFVTITGNGFEIVGRFGVDAVKDGVCPDGVAYDWNKASRIGRTRRSSVPVSTDAVRVKLDD